MFRLFYVLMTFFVVHVILFRVDGMSGKDIVGVTSFILLPATASVNPPTTLEAAKQGFGWRITCFNRTVLQHAAQENDALHALLREAVEEKREINEKTVTEKSA